MICFRKRNIWICWKNFREKISIWKIQTLTSLLLRWELKPSMICWLNLTWMHFLMNCVTRQATTLHNSARMKHWNACRSLNRSVHLADAINLNGWLYVLFRWFRPNFVRWFRWMVVVLQLLTWMICIVVWLFVTTVWRDWLKSRLLK